MVKIFVGRLSPTVTTAQLRELFEQYGTVSDCDILRDYGFVHMSCEVDARKAINALDKHDLCGSKLSVELSTSRAMKSCQLIVKNLPKGLSSQDLHKMFKKYGTVTLCRNHGDNAVVHMRFPSMAANAVKNLNGESYKGHMLSVELVSTAPSSTLPISNAKFGPTTNAWPKSTTREWNSSDIFPVGVSNGSDKGEKNLTK